MAGWSRWPQTRTHRIVPLSDRLLTIMTTAAQKAATEAALNETRFATDQHKKLEASEDEIRELRRMLQEKTSALEDAERHLAALREQNEAVIKELEEEEQQNAADLAQPGLTEESRTSIEIAQSKILTRRLRTRQSDLMATRAVTAIKNEISTLQNGIRRSKRIAAQTRC